MDRELAQFVPEKLRITGEHNGRGWWSDYGQFAAGWLDDAEPEPEIPRMLAFTQRDSRWASVRLGGSAYTMGGSGCAVTSVAILGTLAEPTSTPLDLVTHLNSNGGFTNGLLYWAKAAEFYDGLSFVTYKKWTESPADMAYVRAVIERNPQVIQVDFHPGGALNTHFVVAESMTADGQDIDIIDPWTGERGTLLGAYGIQGWTLARAVYALAEFKLT